jgi:hypothetical protein
MMLAHLTHAKTAGKVGGNETVMKPTLTPKHYQGHSDDVKAKAKALFLQGLRPSVIGEQLGVKRETIATWRSRGHWAEKRADEGTPKETVVPGDPLALVSFQVRSDIAQALVKQANMLSRQRVKGIKDLGNEGKRQGYAGVAKTLAETASIVFGWKSDSASSILVISGSQPKPLDSATRSKLINVESVATVTTDRVETKESIIGPEPQAPTAGSPL